MSLNEKKRLVRALLVWAAFWPIVQFGLTLAFDVSPWKLFGWAMYSGPQLPVIARVLEVRGGSVVDFDMTRLPPAIQSDLKQFERRRLALGRLCPPGRLGEKILDLFPELEGVTIVVSRKRLDRSTGRIEIDNQAYPYVR